MRGLFKGRGVRQILIAGALCTYGGAPALADSLSATASYNTVSTGASAFQNTGTANQVVSEGTAAGPFFAEALVAYGLNRTYAMSRTADTFTQAESVWSIDFALAGGTPGSSVSLGIQYSFDASLALLPGSDYAHFEYTLDGSSHIGGTIFGIRATTFSSGGNDECRSRVPSGGVPDGFCQGSYSSSGTIPVNNIFTVGGNTLTSTLGTASAAGTADAFNTARLLSITVPDGITWRYGPDITGNPLNFQHATQSAVPEPSTFGLLGGVMATLLLFRKGSFARPRR